MDVKRPRTVELNYYYIVDRTVVPNLVPTPVDKAELEKQPNQIFLRQANVRFTVHDRGEYLFHYDLNGNRMLEHNSSTGYFGPELRPLNDTFFSQAPNPPAPIHKGDDEHMYVFFVNEISAPKTAGFAVAGAPQYAGIVQSTWPKSTLPGTPQTAAKPAGYVENLTAHEVGHILGRGAKFVGVKWKKNGQIETADVQTDPHNSQSHFLMYDNNFASVPPPFVAN